MATKYTLHQKNESLNGKHLLLVTYKDADKTEFDEQFTINMKDKTAFDSYIVGNEYSLIPAE